MSLYSTPSLSCCFSSVRQGNSPCNTNLVCFSRQNFMHFYLSQAVVLSQEDHRALAGGPELRRAPHARRALSAGEPGWKCVCTLLPSVYHSACTCQDSGCCLKTAQLMPRACVPAWHADSCCAGRMHLFHCILLAADEPGACCQAAVRGLREELGISVGPERLAGPLAPARRRELHMPAASATASLWKRTGTP